LRTPPGRSRGWTVVGSEHAVAKSAANATLVKDIRVRMEVLVRRNA
jgi:hypothetical protein